MTTLEKISLALMGMEFVGVAMFSVGCKMAADKKAQEYGYKNAKDYLKKVENGKIKFENGEIKFEKR